MPAARRAALWSPEALDDREKIWGYYVDVAGRHTAEKVLRGIGDVIALIEDHPLAGRARDEVRPGLRSCACWMGGRILRRIFRSRRTTEGHSVDRIVAIVRSSPCRGNAEAAQEQKYCSQASTKFMVAVHNYLDRREQRHHAAE